MPKKVPKGERRTIEELRAHYVIEKELASQLRSAGKGERQKLYNTLYDEMYRRVPSHPTLQRSAGDAMRSEELARNTAFLRHFLRPDSVFLELGAGDCRLSLAVAPYARRTYALEVSEEVVSVDDRPANFELIISDGCSIPLPERSVDVAYSNQLMEHLHPDDTAEQLSNIFMVLKPGGVYICVTPNRLSGPHDVSGYFDEVATGFHLKEYTSAELTAILKACGFSRVQAYVRYKRLLLILPVAPVLWIERALQRLPRVLQRAIAGRMPVSLLLNRVIATK